MWGWRRRIPEVAHEALKPEELFDLRFLQRAALSPDGGRAVYGVSWIHGDEELQQLWLVDCETRMQKPLAPGRCRNAAFSRESWPAWSRDGSEIAFLSEREGGTSAIRTTRVKGALTFGYRRLRKMPFRRKDSTGAPAGSWFGRSSGFPKEVVSEFVRSPDDRWFAAVITTDVGSGGPAARTSRSVWRYDGYGCLDEVHQDIWLLGSLRSGARRLTSDGLPKANLRWSPNGRELLFTCGISAETCQESYFLRPRLMALELSGKEREIVGGDGEALSAEWLPDSERIVYIGNHGRRLPGSKYDLWVTDKRGGQHDCRTESLRYGVGDNPQTDMPIGWVADRRILVDADYAYVQVQEGGCLRIYRVALVGPESWDPAVSGDGSSFPLDLRGRKLLFGCTSFHRPVELHLRDLDTGEETRLTDFGEPLSDKALPTIHHLEFTAPDGVPVEGWIMVPACGVKPFPTVLFIHGGPHLAFGSIFSLDAQMLASAGFAVILVNQRGSKGYGDEFANRIIGDWGNRDYRDLMAGIDHAVELGIADPDRLGCYGLSYGGYMACWMAGQTDRFRAVVSENPITDFTSFRGTSDIGLPYTRRELGGRPQEMPDVYRRSSPLTFAHRCRTPLLLIQHLEDYRCPPAQSEQFYAALKNGWQPAADASAHRQRGGCPVEMLRFEGSSHNGAIFGAPEVRKAQNRALLDWMTRFVS